MGTMNDDDRGFLSVMDMWEFCDDATRVLRADVRDALTHIWESEHVYVIFLSASYLRERAYSIPELFDGSIPGWSVDKQPTAYETMKTGALAQLRNDQHDILVLVYCDYIYSKIELQFIHDPVVVMRAVRPSDFGKRDDDPAPVAPPRVPELA